MVQLGPLSIPYSRLFLLLAIFVIGITSEIVARNLKNKHFSSWGWNTGFVALIAARVGFVLTHLSDFLSNPLSMLYIWQGGFHLLGGILGGFLYTLWFFRKTPKQLTQLGLPVLGAFGVLIASLLLTPNTNPAKALPPLELYTLDHTPISLQSYIGKPLVINVWATWCPPCRREMPLLYQMSQENPDITFLFANQGEDSWQVGAYFTSINVLPEHILLDPDLEYSQFQGVVGYPTTFFYDAAGQSISASYGELSRATLNQHLRNIR